MQRPWGRNNEAGVFGKQQESQCRVKVVVGNMEFVG